MKIPIYPIDAFTNAIFCEHRGDRVFISGSAVLYMEGVAKIIP